jgi:hypothetical protein
MFLERFGVHLYQSAKSDSYAALNRCFAHEFGHALDRALSNFSHWQEFDHAFKEDLANLSKAEASKLSYFTQPDGAVKEADKVYDAAKEELFAELFALSRGSGSTSPEVDSLLRKRFPAVVELCDSKMKSVLKEKPD